MSAPAHRRCAQSATVFPDQAATSSQRIKLAAATCSTNDLLRDLFQRNHLACRAQSECCTGHTPYDGGIFILHNGMSTSVAYLQQPLGTIGSHAGQQCSNGTLAYVVSHRSKQYIHRWPVAIDPFRRQQPAHKASARRLQHQVRVTGCKISAAALDGLAIRSLLDCALA